jgi:hypothetical protein
MCVEQPVKDPQLLICQPPQAQFFVVGLIEEIEQIVTTTTGTRHSR